MSKQESIVIRNAKVHNLKGVSLEIPKNKLTVITGLSGSGKSSLAFDTIYAEGQRRYAESLSAYARQFMEVQDKPDVDEIRGLSPTIAIDQRTVSQNPRSTVGTVTEIYDHLRLLFSRIGTQYCPECNLPARAYSPGESMEDTRKIARNSSELLILSPVIKNQEVKPKELLNHLEQTGVEVVRLNGVVMRLPEVGKFKFDSQKKYTIELLLAKISDIKKQDIASPIDRAIDLSNGDVVLSDESAGEEHLFSTLATCRKCGRSFEPIEPRSFSFNSPHGACPRCTGLGITLEVDTDLVIPNPRLTLAEGAIQPWTRIVGNQNKYQEVLQAVADAHDFSVHMPIKDLPKKIMDIVLYGTDGEEYQIGKKKMRYEGVVPNLVQRHAETDSDYVRKEIEAYMRERICPVCHGKRLKETSLAVKIGEWNIADIGEMTVEEALEAFTIIGDEKKNIVHLSKHIVHLS